MPHSHDPAKWVRRYTTEEIAHIKATFDLDNYWKTPFAEVYHIYAYKNCVEVSGRIGKYRVHCSNQGEYRSGVSWDRDKPLLLEDAPTVSISFSVLGDDGVYHSVYSN